MSATILIAAVAARPAGAGRSPWRCAALRMIRGPRAQDRVLGLDALYVNAMLLFLTLGIRTGSCSSSRPRWSSRCSASWRRVALAKFLMRGEVIE